MQAQMEEQIDGDARSHQHYLLSMLEIGNGSIESASMQDGVTRIVVRFTITADEKTVDQSGEVAGRGTTQPWQEDWTFERSAAVSTDADDWANVHPGWLISHKQWVVTKIDRLAAAAPAAG